MASLRNATCSVSTTSWLIIAMLCFRWYSSIDVVNDDDYVKLKSLAHSDSVDEISVKKLLSLVFRPGALNASSSFLVALPIEAVREEHNNDRFWHSSNSQTQYDLDIKEEVMVTVLSYLELYKQGYIELLPSIHPFFDIPLRLVWYIHDCPGIYATCTLNFHKTDPELLKTQHGLVARILATSRRTIHHFQFDVSELAATISMTVPDVMKELAALRVWDFQELIMHFSLALAKRGNLIWTATQSILYEGTSYAWGHGCIDSRYNGKSS